MRVRARLTTATAGLATALAAVTSLSGCMTVHGETAVVPALTEGEAERAFEHYVETSNEALETYDPELNATVETGPLGAIRDAELTARHEVTPEGAINYEPLEFTDARFHIPQQAGWPKYFAVDARTAQDTENRWLLIFTRDGIKEEWAVSYLTVLAADDFPELAEDGDGFLEDIPVEGDTHSGLALEPGELSAAYAEYLSSEGDGPFTEGPYTTDALAAREEANSQPEFITEFRDRAAEDEAYAPVALRTADGGALVLFTSLYHEKRTMAPNEPLVVDPLVEALMDAPAEQALTMEWVVTQAALVPEGEGDIEIVGRVAGVITAGGE
ncbi:hypothetical protein [Streptomyces specialis]|uniref:hypothetical protein n=1 Tax=Streptomyces specialis TaxID=498367 RepID=UPI00073F299F|nr:hypothetical protein [Streptomyces specialis]